MYKKIIYLLFSLYICVPFTYAESFGDEPLIIPRASWGANELYNSLESSYWKSILEQRKNYTYTKPSPEAIEKQRKINLYLNENFSHQFTSSEIVTQNDDFTYAWPLKYANYIDAIVVHHTHSEYENSYEGIKDIYRYHSLNRQYGDIGYNYIIGYDGEIFEGKNGGDYVQAAHSKYNNFGTLGIAVMGNYHQEGINEKQYKSLESLIQYATKKYGIDLTKKRYYHMVCKGEKCNTFPLETYLDSVLVGHRDTGHTNCPGDKLQEQIQEIRENNLTLTAGFTPIKREESSIQKTNYQIPKIQKILLVLKNYSDSDLEKLFNQVNILLTDESLDHEKRKKLQILRLGIILSRKD